MARFPILLELANKCVVIVGAGTVATRRAQALLDAGANLRVVAPVATVKLQSLAEQGRLEWRRRPFQAADMAGADLVVAATDDRQTNGQIVDLARARGIAVNAADDAGDSDFTFPARLQRRRIQLTIDTGGAGPAIAGALRRHLDDSLSPGWARAADMAAQLRPRLKRSVDGPTRRAFWRQFSADLPDAVIGDDDKVRAWLLDLAQAHGIDLGDDDLAALDLR